MNGCFRIFWSDPINPIEFSSLLPQTGQTCSCAALPDSRAEENLLSKSGARAILGCGWEFWFFPSRGARDLNDDSLTWLLLQDSFLCLPRPCFLRCVSPTNYGRSVPFTFNKCTKVRIMLIPKKHRNEIYAYLFKGKESRYSTVHLNDQRAFWWPPRTFVPRPVTKNSRFPTSTSSNSWTHSSLVATFVRFSTGLSLTSLRSFPHFRNHFYWFLTNEGIEYLREYLHLPEEIVPATLKKKAGENFERNPFGGRGGRGRGRGGFRGGRGGARGGFSDRAESAAPPSESPSE